MAFSETMNDSAMPKGVIKFRMEFRPGPKVSPIVIADLNYSRERLYKNGLIGQDSNRYGGEGYGNISRRLSYEPNASGVEFIITGSGTGRLETLTESDFALVLECHPEQNLVIAALGPSKPSSESMTHGTVYDLDLDGRIMSVAHAHSPEIWRSSGKLELPTTRETVEYGTPEMAEEVKRLFRDTNVREKGIFSMGGHEDGIVTFGTSTIDATLKMLKYLALARH